MIILVRHGESIGQVEDRLSGQHNYDLTELGIQQARAAGETLSEVEIDVIYTSPLTRALRTTTLILEQNVRTMKKVFTVDPCLKERSGGEYETMTYSDIHKLLPPKKYKLWQRDYFESPMMGESMADVAERVLPLFDKTIIPLHQTGKTVLVVSHAVVMKVIIGYLQGLNESDIPNMQIENAIPYIFKGNLPL